MVWGVLGWFGVFPRTGIETVHRQDNSPINWFKVVHNVPRYAIVGTWLDFPIQTLILELDTLELHFQTHLVCVSSRNLQRLRIWYT